MVASDTELVRLRAKPNFRSLGKRYGKRTPAIAAAAARLGAEQLRGLERGEPATLEVDGRAGDLPARGRGGRARRGERLAGGERRALRRGAGSPARRRRSRQEGLAREVVNRVQRLRKEAGYVYTDRIGLWISGDGPVLEAVRGHARLHPGRDAGPAAGAGRPGADARSGAAGGHRRAWSGGGSATIPGRPQRGRSATQG